MTKDRNDQSKLNYPYQRDKYNSNGLGRNI